MLSKRQLVLLFVCSLVGVAAAQRATHMVSGRVVDNDGLPMRRVTVSLLPMLPEATDLRYYARNEHVPRARTAADGSFVITGLESGTYGMTVERGSTALKILTVGERRSNSAITVSSDIQGLVLSAQKDTAIGGRVVDEQGEPVRNASVIAKLAVRDGKDYVFAGQAETDDRGQFRIFGLTEGDYYLRAVPSRIQSISSDSLGEVSPTYYPSVLTLQEASPVSLCAGEEAQVDISLQPSTGIHITGSILGIGPNAAASLHLRTSDSFEVSRFLDIDSGGRFEIRDVTPGQYVLGATLYNAKHATGNDDDGPSVETFTATLPLDVQSSVDGITLSPAPPPKIRGRVVISDGSKPNFSTLTVTLLGDALTRNDGPNLVNADGTFEIEDADPGDYRVMLNVRGEGIPIFANHYLAAATFDGREALKAGVHIDAGSGSHVLRLVSNPYGRKLKGQVIDDIGKPVIGARVLLLPEDEPVGTRPDLVGRTASGVDGTFEFQGVAPGKYALVAYERAMTSLDEIPTASEVASEHPQAVHVEVRQADVSEVLKVNELDFNRSRVRSCGREN